jgi:iron complex outermembrane receptor protein
MFISFFWFVLALAIADGALAQGQQPVQDPGPGIVQGTVKTTGGAALADVNVAVRTLERGTTTDSTGGFRLLLPTGTYRLTFSSVGYEPVARSVTVPEGQRTTLDVVLNVSPYTLNEIVVEERGNRPTSTATTVQRIEPAAIRGQDAAAVSDLGLLIPGAHVQTNSRGQTLLYFRNAGDRQTAQFFDGALLNIPWDNRVDVSLIPAGVVESITVAKGTVPVRYGTNTIGGAVNVQSRTLDAPGDRIELQTEIGTAGQRRGMATYLSRTGPWDVTAAVQHVRRGDQPLPADANLAFSQPDEDRRVNTDRALTSAFARGSYRFEGGAQLGVSALHVDASQGVAPESHLDPGETGVRYWRYPTWRKSMLLGSGRTSVGERTLLRGAVWGSRFEQDIFQYRSVAYEALSETQNDRDWTGGSRLLLTRQGDAGSLTAFGNVLTTQHRQSIVPYEPQGPATDSTETFRQHLYNVGLEGDIRLTDGLVASGGISFDGTATPTTGPFPERGAFSSVNATVGLTTTWGTGWTARATGGRKSRFPTMRELFGAALGKFVPNPNLSPVTAWIAEAGIERNAGPVQGGATLFLNRTTDAIEQRTFQSGPNTGREQRINLGGSRVVGVEVTGAVRPVEALMLTGHLTWSQPRGLPDRGDARRLNEKPAWVGTGTATWMPGGGLTLTGQLRHTGGTYARTEANAFTPLPDAWVVDLRAAYRITPGDGAWTGEMFARVDNVTDDATYLQLGLPGPGRRTRVGLSVTL